ncbi:MAG TPA: DUF2750 domain-containing protein [Chitinispirillaceae bacterium]|nr:DUF2750 domain-containing protein [Chitinispirillaceae bacterium]
MDNISEEKKKHQQFIQQVCKSGNVWGLENEEGFAMASSAEFENSDGNAAEVLCFWSDINLAKACANDEWKAYSTTKIELGDFMENWCIGMFEDELLAGTDFDAALSGYELDPLDLILDLCEELKKSNHAIRFENYADIDEFIEEVKSIKN